MAEQAQDRQLPATERKIQKSRGDGQVARSRDLGHLAALGGGAALLAAFAPEISRWLSNRLAEGLRFDRNTLASTATMTERLSGAGDELMLAVLPLGAAMVFLALAAGVLAGGWNFTFKPLEPKFEKLDPLAGLGRMVSGQQVGVMLKACLLALVLGTLGGVYLKMQLSQFAGLMALPLPAALSHAGGLLWTGFALLLVSLALFALVDVPLQRQLLLRRLRMSHQEVKKENKDIEGNAEVKARVR
ncbi:MAG: EscU/YscU/HrcU family type III secretion system export apparatus switch protein, partial [Rubrivivax sp.]|nr:EscU/YscU/HrcU family type III secretion system export apparatus switch protein [Rubrivivax sp.]